MEPNESRHDAVATIASALHGVLKVGVLPAKLRKCQECDELFRLRCVLARASERSDPLRLAFALEAILKDATSALGDGPYGEAAKMLFGVATDAKGRQLKRRRELAADAFGVMVTTFRQNYEDDLVEDLAAEVYRIEFLLPIDRLDERPSGLT